MKRTLLIEPHPDDVCLGLFHFLGKTKADYHLVSVSSNNGRDSKSFCEEMGIKWHPTELVENVPYSNRVTPGEIKRQNDAFIYQRMYWLEQCAERYLEVEALVRKAIEEISCDVVMTTLGIIHPMHILTSIACEMVAMEQDKELIYFAGFPYLIRKFGEKVIEDSDKEYSLVYDESLRSEKVRLFEKHYPTETIILRWDRGKILDSHEVIFSKGQRKGIIKKDSAEKSSGKKSGEEGKRFIFIDGGAERGNTIKQFKRSQLYSRHPWEMFALEADPKLTPSIPEESNLVVIDKAIWIHDGFVELYLEKNWRSNSVFQGGKTKDLDLGSISVPSIDFSRWIKENFNKSDYILLKLNVEGAEYKVLDKMILDGTLDYVDALFVQFHPRRASMSRKAAGKIIDEFERKKIFYQIRKDGRFSLFLEKFEEKKEPHKKAQGSNKETKIAIFSCGGEYMTGAHRHAMAITKAFNGIGMDAKLVESDWRIDDPDIMFLDSIGISNENKSNAKNNERRLKNIEKYMGKIPFVLLRHSVHDNAVYKNSFDFFKDFCWDLVVSLNNPESMMSQIEEQHKFKRLVYIDRPFEFKDTTEDKTGCENIIVSPARIAGCKRTHLILELAKVFGKEKKFLIAGKEKGVYWYRVIKENPNREYAEFIGEYENYDAAYERSAFAIDMTYLYVNGRIQGGKQHTLLEAVNCGNIPIVFENWRYDGGPEAVWFPLPERKGRSATFDVETYAEIMRKSKYDYAIAVENKRILKREHDPIVIADKYREEFRRFSGC